MGDRLSELPYTSMKFKDCFDPPEGSHSQEVSIVAELNARLLSYRVLFWTSKITLIHIFIFFNLRLDLIVFISFSEYGSSLIGSSIPSFFSVA